jgi:ferredoxin
MPGSRGPCADADPEVCPMPTYQYSASPPAARTAPAALEVNTASTSALPVLETADRVPLVVACVHSGLCVSVCSYGATARLLSYYFYPTCALCVSPPAFHSSGNDIADQHIGGLAPLMRVPGNARQTIESSLSIARLQALWFMLADAQISSHPSSSRGEPENCFWLIRGGGVVALCHFAEASSGRPPPRSCRLQRRYPQPAQPGSAATHQLPAGPGCAATIGRHQARCAPCWSRAPGRHVAVIPTALQLDIHPDEKYAQRWRVALANNTQLVKFTL